MVIILSAKAKLKFKMEFIQLIHIILLIKPQCLLFLLCLSKPKEAIATQMMDYFVYKITEKIVINQIIRIAPLQMELIQ